eukprot:6490671-Amphidinium_carterae.1
MTFPDIATFTSRGQQSESQNLKRLCVNGMPCLSMLFFVGELKLTDCATNWRVQITNCALRRTCFHLFSAVGPAEVAQQEAPRVRCKLGY